jgi:zinc protease
MFMSPRFTAGLAGPFLLAACALAQNAPATSIPNLKFEHYRLPNGMQVIFYVDRRSPVVHVNLHFYVGSKDERPGRTGLAHLFEHMMLEGADAGSDFFALTAQLGATDENGATGPDATEYYETVPSARLERMLWLESNRFANLLKILNQERLDNQRGVVRNELRETVENKPYGRFPVYAYENLFPAGHPYSHEVIGTHQDLMAATLEDVRAFYREHYTPDNLSLMLAGDFEPAQARKWIASYFGSWAPGGVKASPPSSAPQLSAPKLLEARDHVPGEKVFFVWPGPGLFDPDYAALDIAGYVLGPHFHRTTDRTSIDFSWNGLLDASMFIMAATAPLGGTLAELDQAIEADLRQFAQDGPTEEELTRARNSLEFLQVKKLENLREFASTVQSVQQYYGNVDRYSDWANRYNRVTAAAVRTAIGRWLATPNRLAIRLLPTDARRDETPEPNRTVAPPFQREKPYRPPELKSKTLPNGLQILVVERHEIPIVAAQMRLKIGSAYDPPGKGGLAMLTMATLESGTTHRGKEQIDEEKRRLALTMLGTADAASQMYGFEVLRKNLEPAVELLADLLRNANFPANAFDDGKKGPIDQFEKPEGRIDDLVAPASAIAFGSRQPLGSLVFGTHDSRRAITAQDAAAFKSRYWKPDVAALTFAGDVTLDEAVAMATKYFGDWSGKAGQPAPTPEPQPMPGRLFLIDKPGATQTMVVHVLPAIAADPQVYPTVLLLDRIWGGTFSSRLNQNIREQQGIAYGAHSQIYPFGSYGLWFGMSPVQADKTHDAMVAFVRELRGLGGEKPVTVQELQLAKDSFLHEYPEQFARAWNAAEHVSRDWAAGLPLDTFQTLPQRVAAVTLAEVNAAARKYARPERAFFLLLGDREKIGTDMRDLGMGELKVMQ